jgi:phosphonate transport system ATP-binding protein
MSTSPHSSTFRPVMTESRSRTSGESFALETRHLGVSYDNGTVGLKPQTLQFRQGDFIVLLGPSGAGKSTLLRSLNGLAKPTSGEVVTAELGRVVCAAPVGGVSKTTLRAHRRRTGMIFQQHHLIGRLTVLENVLMGRIGFHGSLRTLLPASRQEKERALAAIERVGLLDHALRRADQLSGGQQQRVGVARALIQQPTLLLADEPVASLDPSTAEQLLTLIHDICKKDHLTAIVSLHQVGFARQFADRIVGLKTGDVVFDGLPKELTIEQTDSLYLKPVTHRQQHSTSILPIPQTALMEH